LPAFVTARSAASRAPAAGLTLSLSAGGLAATRFLRSASIVTTLAAVLIVVSAHVFLGLNVGVEPN
jgi:hypothetical protein